MWIISLPLRVLVSKKGRKSGKERYFPLNLNHYRNAHFQTLNKAKQAFDDLAKYLIRGIPSLRMVTLEYVLYPGSRQLCDVNNVCSVADKFFSDALVNHKVLEDDNYKFIADTRFKFGHIDKMNPRVEVIIRSPDHPSVPMEPLKESTKNMKISTKVSTVINFTKDDLHAAIREYVSKQTGEISSDAKVDVVEEKNGEYKITIETEATGASEKPARAKKEKLDPKAAMANLKAPAEPTEPLASLPVVGEEKGHAQPAPTSEENVKPESSGLFAVTKLTAPVEEKPKEETPQPTKGTSLFANFKRPSNP
jgi:hypothetical protein